MNKLVSFKESNVSEEYLHTLKNHHMAEDNHIKDSSKTLVLEIFYKEKIINLTEEMKELIKLLKDRNKQIHDLVQEKQNIKQQYA